MALIRAATIRVDIIAVPEALEGLADIVGPFRSGEIEAQQDSGFPPGLFIGGPDPDPFLIGKKGQVEGSGYMTTRKFRRGTDVGDGYSGQLHQAMDGNALDHEG